MAAATGTKPVIMQEKEFPPALQAIVNDRYEVLISPGFRCLDGVAPVALLSASHEPIDGAVLDAHGPGIKVVSNFGVGYDHIDEAACTSRRIPLGNTPGVLTDATAEMAMALLLAHVRRVVEGDARARDPALRSIDSSWFGKQVHGSTVGIVGLGRIGEAIGRRCVAFGASVCYTKRSRASADTEASLGGATFHPELGALLEASDFVILSCPYTAETKGLVGAAEIARMGAGTVLVNIGRGGLVDQEAVAGALVSGALGGYATDVTEPEPLPTGHPLLLAPRCTITPHTGSATLATRTGMLELALRNLQAALDGADMPASPNQADLRG